MSEAVVTNVTYNQSAQSALQSTRPALAGKLTELTGEIEAATDLGAYHSALKELLVKEHEVNDDAQLAERVHALRPELFGNCEGIADEHQKLHAAQVLPLLEALQKKTAAAPSGPLYEYKISVPTTWAELYPLLVEIAETRPESCVTAFIIGFSNAYVDYARTLVTDEAQMQRPLVSSEENARVLQDFVYNVCWALKACEENTLIGQASEASRCDFEQARRMFKAIYHKYGELTRRSLVEACKCLANALSLAGTDFNRVALFDRAWRKPFTKSQDKVLELLNRLVAPTAAAESAAPVVEFQLGEKLKCVACGSGIAEGACYVSGEQRYTCLGCSSTVLSGSPTAVAAMGASDVSLCAVELRVRAPTSGDVPDHIMLHRRNLQDCTDGYQTVTLSNGTTAHMTTTTRTTTHTVVSRP